MSEQLVEVKITSLVTTSRYGSLGPGDKLWTDPAYAKHLVEECAAAKYVIPDDSENTQVPEKEFVTLTQKAMRSTRSKK